MRPEGFDEYEHVTGHDTVHVDGFFGGPTDVAWDADEHPGRIYKLTLDGEILGMLGESGRQLGQFNWLHGIDCSQEGILYIADLNNWRVQKLILNP